VRPRARHVIRTWVTSQSLSSVTHRLSVTTGARLSQRSGSVHAPAQSTLRLSPHSVCSPGWHHSQTGLSGPALLHVPVEFALLAAATDTTTSRCWSAVRVHGAA